YALLVEQLIERNELLCQVVAGGEVDQRLVGVVGLAHFHRVVEIDRQHRVILRFQFLDDLGGKIGAGLKQVGDDAIDGEIFVVVLADFRQHIEDVVQRLSGKGVAVEGYQAAVGADQRGIGIEIQGGRSVDVDLVEVVVELVEQVAQFVDLV